MLKRMGLTMLLAANTTEERGSEMSRVSLSHPSTLWPREHSVMDLKRVRSLKGDMRTKKDTSRITNRFTI